MANPSGWDHSQCLLLNELLAKVGLARLRKADKVYAAFGAYSRKLRPGPNLLGDTPLAFLLAPQVKLRESFDWIEYQIYVVNFEP